MGALLVKLLTGIVRQIVTKLNAIESLVIRP